MDASRTTSRLGEAKKPPTDTAKDVLQTADTMLRYFWKDVNKTQVARHFPFFGMVLAVLVTILLLTDLRLTTTGSARYTWSTLLDTDQFEVIESRKKFWEWTLQGPVERLWDKSWTNQTSPLGFLLLRQFRMNPAQGCRNRKHLNVLPHHIRRHLRDKCPQPFYDEEQLSTADYRPTSGRMVQPLLPANYFPWRANVNIPRPVNSITVEGLHTYSSPEKAFTILLPFNLTKAEIIEEVRRLDGWIDDWTIAIAVELLAFNHLEHHFVAASLLLEVLPSSFHLPRTWSKSFTVDTLGSPRYTATFFLHMVVAVYVVLDLVNTILTSFQNRRLSRAGSGVLSHLTFEVVVQLAIFYILLSATYYKVLLVQHATEMTSDSFYSGDVTVDTRTMWTNLVQYAARSRQEHVWFSLAAVFFVMRVLWFVQYNDRLGILTETLNVALTDLLTLIFIMALTLVSFTTAGHLLYRSSLHEFRSWGRTMTFLLFMITSGNLDPYPRMEEMHTWFTPIYVTSFLAMTWVIMLNMMIAVITGSFQMVQDAMQKERSWSPAAIWKDLRAYFINVLARWKYKLKSAAANDADNETPPSSPRSDHLVTAPPAVHNPLAPDNQDSGQRGGEGQEAGHRDSTHTDAVPPQKKVKGYIQRRYAAAETLRRKAQELGVPLREYNMTEEDFYALLGGFFTREMVTKIFHKASREIYASASLIKISNHDAAAIAENMVALESLVPNVQYLYRIMQKVDFIVAQLVESDRQLLELSRGTPLSITTIYDRIKKMHERASNLVTSLLLIDDSMEDAHKTSEFQDMISDGSVETKKAAAQAYMLQRQAANIIQQLEENTKNMVGLIRRGMEHALPTDRIHHSTPIFLDRKIGKGMIDSVERHGYIGTGEDDEPAVVAADAHLGWLSSSPFPSDSEEEEAQKVDDTKAT